MESMDLEVLLRAYYESTIMYIMSLARRSRLAD